MQQSSIEFGILSSFLNPLEKKPTSTPQPLSPLTYLPELHTMQHVAGGGLLSCVLEEPFA